MYIELTDHLRCPADHEESYLVLLPDRVEDRSVRAGQLGCPVCGRSFALVDGVLDVGGAPEPLDAGAGPRAGCAHRAGRLERSGRLPGGGRRAGPGVARAGRAEPRGGTRAGEPARGGA